MYVYMSIPVTSTVLGFEFLLAVCGCRKENRALLGNSSEKSTTVAAQTKDT